MSSTGTQKAQYKCSRCGQVFDSPQALQEHEKECKTKLASQSGKESDDVQTDMLVEDRFEASDN